MNRRWTQDGYERRCGRCHEWKRETNEHFAYNSRRDVFNSWCKPCASEYSRNRGRTRRVRPGAPLPADQQGRAFGLEIEFVGDQYSLVQRMREQGLRCEIQDYNHTTQHGLWKIVPDGSVHNGAELVSPPLRGEDGRRQVEAASRALRAAGCRTSRSTGLHVHHDVSDLRVEDFQRLVRNWFHSQDAIDALVSPSRRGGRNTYCRRLDTYDLARVDSLRTMERHAAAVQLRGDRYRTLNFQSYGKYGTVEVRQHQGTLNATKMLAWVDFGQAMIEHAKQGATMTAVTTAEMLDTLTVSGMTTRTHAHLVRRTVARTAVPTW